ncbi:MAG: T9SS type A sorting domain-containing protein [Bacteroidia bacterium]|nr:T9SS type A sorting domain-containing protein [Bacteroidia bacterium]
MKVFQSFKNFPKLNVTYVIGLILCFFFTVSSFSIFAQTTFTESASSFGLAVTGSKDGGLAFADYDNDGDQDVLINAATYSSGVSYLYRNDGTTFTNVTSSLAPKLSNDNLERQAVWGDLNNDGLPDFMRTTGGTGSNRLEIYLQDSATGIFGRGNGNSNPIRVGSTSTDIFVFSGLNCEGAGFFDFDGDGDLDIYFDNHNYGVDILQNNYINHTTNAVVDPAYNALFTHITTGTGTVLGLAQSATDGDYAASADVNDDGWVDLFIRKRNENDFFMNQGRRFTNGQDLGQSLNSNKGAVALFDLDNDGDFDAIWTDNDGNYIYENISGVFSKLTGKLSIQSRTDIDGVDGADVDNDGDIDLVFTGNSKSYIFYNQINSPTSGAGTGTAFTFNLDATFSTNGSNSGNGEGVVFVDIDNDGDMDFYENKSGTNKLWINNLYSAATASIDKEYIVVHAIDDRPEYMKSGEVRYALGANVVIKDCDGNVISGIRNVNGGSGHGTQNPLAVHFGLPYGLNSLYFIQVSFPNYKTSSGTTRNIISRVINPAYDGSSVTIFASEIDLNMSCEQYDVDRDTVPNGYDIDDDEDGIMDIIELFDSYSTDFSQLDTILYDNSGNGVDPTADSDKDGISNYIDADDENFTNVFCVDSNSDGMCDYAPYYFDKDKDNIPDFFDLDSDNDGIPDIIEANGVDVDGNGRVDTLIDSDGDGLMDLADQLDTDGPFGTSPCTGLPGCLWTSSTTSYFDTDANGVNDWDGNTDNDSLLDFKDTDSDNDGIPDLIELGGIDTDNNGYVDQFNLSTTTFTSNSDLDKDGWAGAYDGDNNNDLNQDNTNQLVDVSLTSDLTIDTDRDGYPDHQDLDSDYDGIPDVVEAQGADADGDGRVDNAMVSGWDNDNDGWSSYYDGDNSNSGTSSNAAYTLVKGELSYTNLDKDGDGIPNHLDIDSDNDGLLDQLEVQEGDNKALGSYQSLSGTDSDGDGLDDLVDTDNSDGILTTTTANGTAYAETGSANSNGEALSLGDLDDFDNDNVPNYIDIDSDNDGILDILEVGSSGTAPYTAGNFPADFANPATTDADADVGPIGTGDGLLDLWDANTSAINGSVGRSTYDDSDDADGAPDYLDYNSDGDATLQGDSLWDYIEHFDFDRNAYSQGDLELLASSYIAQNGGTDSSTYDNTEDVDADGYPDWLDGGIADGMPNFLDPTTSYYSDADGDGLVDLLDADQNGSTPFSYLGYDIVGGTVLPYPVNLDNSGDPDFRDFNSPIYLPVDLILFQVNAKDDDAVLTWETATETNNDRFIVERSFDGSDFEEIGFVLGSGTTNEVQRYTFIDENIKQHGLSELYYRLKQVDHDNSFDYSEIRLITLTNTKNIKVYPNPARSVLKVTSLPQNANLAILNSSGQVIEKQNITNGELELNVSEYRKGIYFISVYSESAIQTLQFVIVK